MRELRIMVEAVSEVGKEEMYIVTDGKGWYVEYRNGKRTGRVKEFETKDIIEMLSNIIKDFSAP